MASIEIYTDGACKGNPGLGGWAAIVRNGDSYQEFSGSEENTTNNRMEVLAAIKGLEACPKNSLILLNSDSLYLVNTMTKGWKRNANTDLWSQLDTLVSDRDVTWQWVKGHDGNPGNERADQLASYKAENPDSDPSSSLSHIDAEGRAVMVDVGWKDDTARSALASGRVLMSSKTVQLVEDGQVSKGDVLTVARIAGIMGAKKTSELIPLCHPLPLNNVTVDLAINKDDSCIEIKCTANTTAKTGVEMEALMAVYITALTIYDMCKAVDKAMKIENIRLISKVGGKSGDFFSEDN